LSCAVFQPFIGSLSEIFGRQQLLIPSLTLFTVGCIIAGVAHNFTTLLVGRVIQGVGGGGIITLAQVIFTDIVPLRHRPKWWTIIQASWALGTVIGPLIGGLFVQHSTWRWIFWINFPFCGIGFVMVPLVIRLKTKKTSFKEKLFRVDWIGGIIFIASLTSFLIAISWGGIQYSWSSWRTLVPMLFGGVGLIGALEWEWYAATEPVLRRSLFYNWSAKASYICAVVQGLLVRCHSPSQKSSS
jgi:MFS family permease